MALTTINAAKEEGLTYQPLLLAEFAFSDGATVLRVCTHPLNVAEGGYQYNGHDYLARVKNEDLAAIQMASEQGIDRIPSVTLHLMDPDVHLWTYYEKLVGFEGAILTLTFLFWDVGTNTFSSDSITKFVGRCDGASHDGRILSVAANGSNLQKVSVPVARAQVRCPHIFPTTAAQRAAGFANADSEFWECGYCPESGRGNYETGTTPYGECGYTRDDCMLRLGNSATGDIGRDNDGTATGSFGGITYSTPGTWYSKSYLEGKDVQVKNVGNAAQMGKPYPMVYGTAWVSPLVLHSIADGNSVRCEAVLCAGKISGTPGVSAGGIQKVLVNDVEIPFHAYYNADPLCRWNWVNTGERNGAPSQDALYDGKGDPYGSLACIEIVVYRPKIADDLTAANVRVLMSGTEVRVYAATDIWTDGVYDDATGFWYKKIFSSNPVWVLLDLITWGDYLYTSVDVQAFIDAAAIADELISYTDSNGETSTHPRYSCSLVIEQRESLANIVNGLLQGMNAVLTRAEDLGGKLQIQMKGPLAEQQPEPVSGSNYNTAVVSKTRDGVAANGYVAYKFDEHSIIRDSLKITQKAISDSPNTISVTFVDSENQWVEDTNSLVDSAAVARAGQAVTGNLSIRGANTFDQVRRVSSTDLAEVHRGNPRNDAGGTYWFELESSFRIVHLKTGHLCLLNSTKYGLTNQLVRVTKIQPAKNYERAKVFGFFHNDNWYTDLWGQKADQGYEVRRRDTLARPALSWGPYGARPVTGDSMYASEDWSFGLQPRYETAKDGSTITNLEIPGRIPVTSFCTLKTPRVGLQGTTASSGGSFDGFRRYYMAVCAVDAAGGISLPSEICAVDVAQGGSTNTITMPVLSWDAATVSYHVFAGLRPSLMTWQASGSGRPSSITLTSLKARTWGMPDQEFDRLRVKVKRVQHSGVFGAAVYAVGANQIQIAVPSPGFSADQFNAYDCSILALDDNTAVPIANFRVTDTTWDSETLIATLTVTPSPADAAINIQPYDVLVMRSKPTVSGLRLTDANWSNPLSGSGEGLAAGAEVGRMLRFIAGPGTGETYRIAANGTNWVEITGSWRTTPTADSRYIIEDASWLSETTSDPFGDNTDTEAVTTLRVEVSSYENKMLLVQVFAVDGGGDEALDIDSPFREVWVIGGTTPTYAEAVAPSANEGYYVNAGANTVTPDLANGLNHEVPLDRATTTIAEPIWTGETIVDGMRLVLKLKQDATGGRQISWNAAYKGVSGFEISGDANTYSSFSFVRNGSYWELKQQPLIGATA